MHAIALKYLYPNLIKADKALDIGSGSGYLTLAMANCMEKGLCIGIEHIPELV